MRLSLAALWLVSQLAPLAVESCHCSVGAGLAVQATVNDAAFGAVTLAGAGWPVICGVVLTVSVAALLVADPAVFAQSDRYWFAFSASEVGLTARLAEVWPVTLFHVAPPSVESCHCWVRTHGFMMSPPIKRCQIRGLNQHAP